MPSASCSACWAESPPPRRVRRRPVWDAGIVPREWWRLPRHAARRALAPRGATDLSVLITGETGTGKS